MDTVLSLQASRFLDSADMTFHATAYESSPITDLYLTVLARIVPKVAARDVRSCSVLPAVEAAIGNVVLRGRECIVLRERPTSVPA